MLKTWIPEEIPEKEELKKRIQYDIYWSTIC